MLKRLFLIGPCILMSAAAQATALPAGCVEFTWSRIEAGEFVNERGAIHIPVRVSALNGTVPFQLDTGSRASMIYDGALPPAASPPPATLETEIGVDAVGWMPSRRTLKIKTGMSAKSSRGTLGVDMLGNGFSLDLPRRRLCALSAERATSVTNWQPIERSNGSPVIIVNDGTRDLRLLLDTGSSAFSVISTNGRTEALGKAKVIRSLKVPSFGTTITVQEKTPTKSFTAFGQRLDVPLAYAFEHPFAGFALSQAKIDGLIGLSPFMKGELIMDFANNRIAFVR